MTDKMFNNNGSPNEDQGSAEREPFVPDFGEKDAASADSVAAEENNSFAGSEEKAQQVSASEAEAPEAENMAGAASYNTPGANDTVKQPQYEAHQADNGYQQPPYNNGYTGNYSYYGNAGGNYNSYQPPHVNNGAPYQQYQSSNGAPGYNYNANGGEYRYRPPYATYGSNCPPPHNNNNTGYTPPQEAPNVPPAKQKKIKGRSFTGPAIAIVLIACIILSFGAGFGGAYLSNMLFGEPENTSADKKDDDAIIMYQSAMVTNTEGEPISDELSVEAVADLVAASVVEITTEFQTTYGPYQYVSSGAGSGVIVTDNGYIVTNNHVIMDDSNVVADTITVRLKNTTEYKAKFVGADSDLDIAVLKIEATGIKPAILGNSDQLAVGQQVVAVGNPLGELGGTVTSGIISATGRTIDVGGVSMTLIQTDAAVNPGNSGGGLFNLKGELIGIVNAKSTGDGVEGLGFAIPINEGVRVAEQLMEYGYVKGKTYIGVSFVDITNEFDAYRYFGSSSLGVYVAGTEDGYNSEVLKKGDRVVKINDTEIASTDEIRNVVKESKVGDVLKFTLFRGGKMMELDVTCYENIPEEFR